MKKIPMELIYIFMDESGKNISMKAIFEGEISKIETYKLQVNEWFFKPILILGENKAKYNIGMSMFILELMFFESHGQFLKGKDSNKDSKIIFNDAFERFLKYLIEKKKLDDTTINIIGEDKETFYNLVRCGLFHDGYIRDGFLVDSRIEKRNEGKSFYKESGYDDWLVNPWVLIKDLQDYFNNYINDLESGTDQNLKDNFNKMFNKFYKNLSN